MIISLDGCSCSIMDPYIGRENIHTLQALFTEPSHRRKNSAKKVLRVAKKWADKNQKVLELVVGPFADQPVSEGDLVIFYYRMGFNQINKRGRRTRTIYMRYYPKNRSRSSTG